jgi:methyl-accepting chemotaxis protein
MTITEINEKIRRNEYEGERLINKFRFFVALIYTLGVAVVSITRGADGLGYLPVRAHIGSSLLLFYAIIIYFYHKKNETLHNFYKYICVTGDMLIITASIAIGCTYPDICPPLSFLSIWALFYVTLIILGSFRYSEKCAYYSGIFAGLCYFIVVIIYRDVIDLPYSFSLRGRLIPVEFPLLNEVFRVLGMVVAGIIAGMASKRHVTLFNNLMASEMSAADAAEHTVEQTRSIAKTIRKSTDEIFLSSKDIFNTANNQSATVKEIETTITEHTQIAGEIA